MYLIQVVCKVLNKSELNGFQLDVNEIQVNYNSNSRKDSRKL